MDFNSHCKLLAALFLSALLGTLSPAASASLVWHWEEPFTASEKRQLTTWLEETRDALERFVGPFPFDVHVYMKRHSRGGEPVPWANTWRAGEQALHFYVDTDYSLDEFLGDWTAPHEMAHLILPYVGRENSWFAEGFASYLQHSLMAELGVISADEALARRDRRMRAATAVLDAELDPLPDNVASLRQRRQFPTFYWGGAVYWERVDARLQEQGSSLQQVLTDYLDCCRMGRHSLDDLAAVLDRAGATEIFSEELAMMRREPGCPERPTS